MRISGFLSQILLDRGRNFGLLITLILCLLLISLFSPRYLSLDNLMVVALQVSFVGIAAIGTAYLIIGGSVDLSIGSQYALCAVASAMLARSMPSPLAWFMGIALGALLGLTNGLLVWRVSISPIIMTLGTLTIFRGIALRITNGFGVRGVPKSFAVFGQARWLNIPMPVLIFVLLALLARAILQYTRQGRHLSRHLRRISCQSLWVCRAYFRRGIRIRRNRCRDFRGSRIYRRRGIDRGRGLGCGLAGSNQQRSDLYRNRSALCPDGERSCLGNRGYAGSIYPGTARPSPKKDGCSRAGDYCLEPPKVNR